MLKNILNLEGAKQLTEKEQKNVFGGIPPGCTQTYWTGTSLADCRTRYSYATYNATSHVCYAVVCGTLQPA